MINNNEYIYGVHCGDSNCYACGTQRYNCDELDNLDAKMDDAIEESEVVAQYECERPPASFDIDWGSM